MWNKEENCFLWCQIFIEIFFEINIFLHKQS